jgi:transposase
MRFYRGTHAYYCGVDLHARTMYLRLSDQQGQILVDQNLRCEPAAFLEAVGPYKQDLAVTAECIFCWYWLADLCASHGITFILAHALYLKAIHGGKAKNDPLDADKLLVLLRAGAIPMAYVYPPAMRATRDLMRRRLFFTRKRAELFTHIQNTFHQYNLLRPAGDMHRAKHRAQLAACFSDPVVRTTIEADLQVCTLYDSLIQDLEKTIERQARAHDPTAFLLLKTIPGIGKILALTILYEIHTIDRFPRVQDFSSYCRLVKPAHTSAGKRVGSGGSKIGSAHLKWAFSEAAVSFLHGNPCGQALIKRMRKRYGSGKALSILASRLARAAYFMLKQHRAFDEKRFFCN